MTRRSPTSLVLAAAATVALAACGSSVSAQGSGDVTTTAPATTAPATTIPATTAPATTIPATTVAPTTTTATASGAQVTIDSNGKTISVHKGQKVSVHLASTSFNKAGDPVLWTIDGSSDTKVLAASPINYMCMRGSTCGEFTAVATGTAHITGMGPSGLLCQPGGTSCVAVTAMRFDVTVTVTA